MSKVKFGLSNVYVSKFTIGTTGTYTYSTPIKIPGAVNISLSPAEHVRGVITKFQAWYGVAVEARVNKFSQLFLRASNSSSVFITWIIYTLFSVLII